MEFRCLCQALPKLPVRRKSRRSEGRRGTQSGRSGCADVQLFNSHGRCFVAWSKQCCESCGFNRVAPNISAMPTPVRLWPQASLDKDTWLPNILKCRSCRGQTRLQRLGRVETCMVSSSRMGGNESHYETNHLEGKHQCLSH